MPLVWPPCSPPTPPPPNSACAICASPCPETGERISHGIPAFDVAGKMFAYFRHNHHGDGLTCVCVKTAGRDEQEFLWEADPDTYSKPAYLWPSGWVAVCLAEDRVDWNLVEARLRSSWTLAAPKRLTKATG